MKPSQALEKYRQMMHMIASSHHVCNLRVFGSVVHGDDTEGSDLDLLVDPTPMDIGAFRMELMEKLGLPVDG